MGGQNETELDKAEELLIRALELEPDYADAMTNLALILAASGAFQNPRQDAVALSEPVAALSEPADLSELYPSLPPVPYPF